MSKKIISQSSSQEDIVVHDKDPVKLNFVNDFNNNYNKNKSKLNLIKDRSSIQKEKFIIPEDERDLD